MPSSVNSSSLKLMINFPDGTLSLVFDLATPSRANLLNPRPANARERLAITLHLPALNALGDRPPRLGERADGTITHLPQVHPHRVVCFVERVPGVRSSSFSFPFSSHFQPPWIDCFFRASSLSGDFSRAEVQVSPMSLRHRTTESSSLKVFPDAFFLSPTLKRSSGSYR